MKCKSRLSRPVTFYNAVGPQIRKLRDNKGWTQEQLTAKFQIAGLDITRSGLAKIEAKQLRVRDYQLVIIARVLGVSVETLFPPVTTERVNDTVQQWLRKR